ncbi:syntaxin binding protein [Reticulomyxa filosa]|uniref:Syntaxin binding protein n=1 Tax=Reticulomyxa filosa TaxID=46433 RepID=X6M243_RETFI|nr:syntaxin binding protein [Reticulomyxa filosa]|eukprot:ETO07934.1 syntaxin binding protein [Reticulomyxa filosa]
MLSSETDGRSEIKLAHLEAKRDRATLLVLDRADDPLTPLLHSMTFQAMVCDLLADRIRKDAPFCFYAHQYTICFCVVDTHIEESESRDEQIVLPTEEDKVWGKYRHAFIGEVNKRLPKEFNEWRNESAVVKFRDKKGAENLSNSELLKAAQDMPQYQQQIRRFKTNLDLAQAVTKCFGDQKLLDVILLEQDIACWIDSDGKKCDRDKLGARCSQDIFLSKDIKSFSELKLRLLMIYMISHGGLSDSTRKTLFEQARFSEKEQTTIMNLSALQVVLSSVKPPKEGHKNSEYWAAVQRAAKEHCEKSSEDSSPIRFLSFLEWALTNHIEGTEGKFEEHFPFVRDRPSGGKSRKRQATSFRKHKKGTETEKAPSGPRIIVYILGGVTYSELCTCYELSEKHNIDIFGSVKFEFLFLACVWCLFEKIKLRSLLFVNV